MHDMPNRENNPKDQPQQPDRRRQDRRPDNPDEERRRQEPHQNPQMAHGGTRMTPDSLPQKENGNWADENFQSGTSQAQKSQTQTKEQSGSPQRHEQNPSSGNPSSGNPSSGAGRESAGRDKGFNPQGPEKKRESGDRGNFGDNRGTAFGRQDDAHRSSGGKLDPSQRDMGQTGQRK